MSSAPHIEEADDAASSITRGRDTPDVFIGGGVATIEEATGEKVVELEDDNLATDAAARIEVPKCVEHQPYIPLQSAQAALSRVKRTAMFIPLHVLYRVSQLYDR